MEWKRIKLKQTKTVAHQDVHSSVKFLHLAEYRRRERALPAADEADNGYQLSTLHAHIDPTECTQNRTRSALAGDWPCSVILKYL